MKEEIIKMARECGDWNGQTVEMNDVGLQRFFHMAQAAMVKQGWRKCAEGQKTTQFCEMTEKAVLAEREACAKLVQSRKTGANELMDAVRDMEAYAIRGRGKA